MGFPWAWLALGGRKRVPWLLATFRDFESPEYVPRTSARAHMCTAVFMRAPCVPRNREHEKRSAGERAKNAYVQKKSIWYIVICQKGENQRRGLSAYKKNERQGRTWSTDATSTYSNVRRAEERLSNSCFLHFVMPLLHSSSTNQHVEGFGLPSAGVWTINSL